MSKPHDNMRACRSVSHCGVVDHVDPQGAVARPDRLLDDLGLVSTCLNFEPDSSFSLAIDGDWIEFFVGKLGLHPARQVNVACALDGHACAFIEPPSIRCNIIIGRDCTRWGTIGIAHLQ